MRMGSLLYTQLSADPGEGTGGKKGNQKKMIKFYAFFPLCLHLTILCLCLQDQVKSESAYSDFHSCPSCCPTQGH